MVGDSAGLPLAPAKRARRGQTLGKASETKELAERNGSSPAADDPLISSYDNAYLCSDSHISAPTTVGNDQLSSELANESDLNKKSHSQDIVVKENTEYSESERVIHSNNLCNHDEIEDEKNVSNHKNNNEMSHTKNDKVDQKDDDIDDDDLDSDEEELSEDDQVNPYLGEIAYFIEDPRAVLSTKIMDVEILQLVHPAATTDVCDIESEENARALEKLKIWPKNKDTASALTDYLDSCLAKRTAMMSLPNRRRQAIYFRDQPFFPSYMWPQGKGEWWVPLLFVKCLLGMTNQPEENLLKAWGLRKGTSIRERDFLLRFDCFSPAITCLGDYVRLVQCDRFLSWCKEFRPDAYSRYRHAAGIPFLGFSAANRRALLDRIHSCSATAAPMASNFNQAIAQERKDERFSFYDPMSQVTFTACDDHLHLVGYRLRNLPVTYMKGQVIELVPTPLDVYKLPPRPSPPNVVSVLHSQRSGIRKTFDFDEEYKRYLLKRAIEKFGSSVISGHAPANKDNDICAICEYTSREGPNGNRHKEDLLFCSLCDRGSHASCLQLSPGIVVAAKTYSWQCLDCKICEECGSAENEKDILFCDECDRGYHTFCAGLTAAPRGRWICSRCAQCDCCKARPENPTTYKWAHVSDRRDGQRRFLHTLCEACHKKWTSGLFCPICLDIFLDGAETLTCKLCARQVHRGCENLTLEEDALFKAEDNKFVCGICSGFHPEIYDAFHRKHLAC